MTTIYFNAATFRVQFPAFANSTDYTDVFLQVQWDAATNYIGDKSYGWYCGGMTLGQRTQALNLMTAHLVALSDLIAAGGNIGFETSASIDKVSVTVAAPPAPNQWQYWLNLTPYGQQLLALLQIAAAGGRFYNAAPVFTAFRR